MVLRDSAFAVDDWPAWPTYGLSDDLLPALRHWVQHDEVAAIATLVHISGSSPRPLGSEMAISARGDIAGYVSGGCVEGTVAVQAESVLADGRPKLLDYGAGSPVLDVQLTCGGRIGIFLRRIGDLAQCVAQHDNARRERAELFVDIDFDSGDAVAHREPKPRAEGQGFRQHYPPPTRLMLVGGDPVTLAIGELATLMGVEVGLIRPYGPSAPPPGMALCHYDTRALASALPDLPLDAWTAVYSLTHDMADDQSVISHALRSPAFRVGVLGSRRKAEQRRVDLHADGFDDADLARLDMPAGLDIGATGPREIALSILAEITAHRPRARPVAF
ncbi:hypothetical protein SAHY_07347 [Salinisphaera hydrothermalis EPR70]